jgi:hypothetical protein
VALAGVHVNVSIDVLTLAVDVVFSVERVVLVKRSVRPKAVSVGGERLLLAIGQEESNRRFLGGFRWKHIPAAAATIRENEHGCLVRDCTFYVRA